MNFTQIGGTYAIVYDANRTIKFTSFSKHHPLFTPR